MQITIDGIEYDLVEKDKQHKNYLKKVEYPEVEFIVSGDEMTWDEANDWCAERKGRLPTMEELHAYRSQICDYLGEKQNNYFWSASTRSNNSSNAWYVYLGSGSTTYFIKTNSLYVVCVR